MVVEVGDPVGMAKQPTNPPGNVRLAVDVSPACRYAVKLLAMQASLNMGELVEAILSGAPCPITTEDIAEAMRRYEGRESPPPKGGRR